MLIRQARLIGGVVAASLSVACFRAIEGPLPVTPRETAITIAAYLLAGISLGLIYRALKGRQ